MPSREHALLASSMVFAVVFATLAAAYALVSMSEGSDPCTSLPPRVVDGLSCGKVSFTTDGRRLYARVGNSTFLVAERVGGRIDVADKELWGFYLYCCHRNLPEKERPVDPSSFSTVALAVSVAIAALYYVSLRYGKRPRPW